MIDINNPARYHNWFEHSILVMKNDSDNYRGYIVLSTKGGSKTGFENGKLGMEINLTQYIFIVKEMNLSYHVHKLSEFFVLIKV